MRTSAREELAKAEKLLETIEKLPVTIAAREAEAARILGKRKAAAERIEVLLAEQAEALPKLQAALAWAEAGVQAARDRLATATEELRVAKHAMQAEARDTDAAIGQQRAVLYETAPPELDAAIEFFRGRLAFLRSPGRISTNRTGAVKNLFTWTKTAKSESNEAAVLAAMQFCQGAIAELEAMRLRPEVDVARIESLKAEIPPTDVFTETEAEKPMEAVRVSPLRAMAAHADAMVDRLLGRV